MMNKFYTVLFMLSAVTGLVIAGQIGNEFTYQGELQDGSVLADGDYDLTFELYDAAVDGTSVVPLLSVEDVAVSSGVFSVELDFGSAAFMGDQLWLEITVRPGSSTGAYQTLEPRQKITATPYALHAEMVALDSIGGAEIADDTITSADIATGSIDASDIIDGSGSNLDADLLDGVDSTQFAAQNDVSDIENEITNLMNTVTNLQNQIDALANQAPAVPKILGISSQTSNGRFIFGSKTGTQAANEMCTASYPSNPTAHLCDVSEVNRAVAAGNYGTLNFNNVITWSVFPNAESYASSSHSLYNTCQNLLYNAGDVGNGVSMSIFLNYSALGGGVIGDVVNIRPNTSCSQFYPVLCCE